ncbi:MAG TPA: SDR family oxidoreductase [Gemmatimonadaceae bacterium]|nr:SDR family oxidoreductase [Gemmatimonadaceae bacterium]
MTLPLAERAAVVTGASRGIGLAIARALAGAGARVALLARSADALERAAGELGKGAMAVPGDLATLDGVARAARAVTDAFGAVDILVNNAGVFVPRPLEAITPAEFEDTIRVNLVSPFALVHAVLPGMRERGRGHIVTIGSVADRVAFPENGAYSPSKFALRALHEVMRAELRGTGIRATLVSPGPTDTPIWDPIHRAGTGRFPPREAMLPAAAVADAVLYAVTQPERVNVEELRLSSA